MLRILTCNKNGELVESQDSGIIRDVLADPQLNVWIDMEDPGDEDIDVLLEVFHFLPLAVEDVVIDTSIPKLDVFENYAFLNLHRVFYSFEKENCDRRDFEVFFSDKYIVTCHESNLGRTFARTREKIKDNPKKTLGVSPCYVLLRLLELAVKDYMPVMEEWQDNLESIEQQVLKGTAKDDILDQILKFKKLVATMRKSLMPEREIISELYDNPNLPWIPHKAQPYFKSAIDDVSALFNELESLGEHAKSVFDVYAAVLTIRMTESSNKLNYIMQRLTIAATIFLPLTFIVGVYGMNFDDMPELRWPGFYYILWGLMIGLVTGMIVFFKKRGWI